MAETEQQKIEREKREREQREGGSKPVQTQEEQDKANKEAAEKSAKETEQRTAQAYQHETPTPTQAENDAAKLNAAGGGQQNPGFGGETAEAKQKRLEAQKSGGYQTRSTQPQR